MIGQEYSSPPYFSSLVRIVWVRFAYSSRLAVVSERFVTTTIDPHWFSIQAIIGVQQQGVHCQRHCTHTSNGPSIHTRNQGQSPWWRNQNGNREACSLCLLEFSLVSLECRYSSLRELSFLQPPPCLSPLQNQYSAARTRIIIDESSRRWTWQPFPILRESVPK